MLFAGSHGVSLIPDCLNRYGKEVQVLPYLNDCFHQVLEARKMQTGAHAIPRAILGPYLRYRGARPKCIEHILGSSMTMIATIVC